MKRSEISETTCRQRLQGHFGISLACMVFGMHAVACEDHTPAAGPFDENIGLFTPGHVAETRLAESRMGSAGTGETDGGEETGSIFDCLGTNIPASPATAGQEPAECLVIELQTDGPPGDYDKLPGERANNGVIWIEDTSGGYVTGLRSWAGNWSFSSQATWLFTRSRANCPDPDIRTTATLHVHETHRLVWSCQDTAGNVVPDGNYLLWVEVQVDEEHRQSVVKIPFVKGREPYTTMAPPAPTVKFATLTYTPIP